MTAATKLVSLAREHLEQGGYFAYDLTTGFHVRGKHGPKVYAVRLLDKNGVRVPGVSKGTFDKLRRCKIIYFEGLYPEGCWYLKPGIFAEDWDQTRLLST